MNISKDICDAIQQHKEIQVEVQKYASELSAYNEIIQGKSKMHVIKIIMKQIGYKISEKYFFSYILWICSHTTMYLRLFCRTLVWQTWKKTSDDMLIVRIFSLQWRVFCKLVLVLWAESRISLVWMSSRWVAYCLSTLFVLICDKPSLILNRC